VTEASRSLYMEPAVIAMAVQSFVRANILLEDGNGRYRFAPPPGTVSEALDSTATMFNERRTTVIDLIYADSANGVTSPIARMNVEDRSDSSNEA
jgi:hypothetical protein